MLGGMTSPGQIGEAMQLPGKGNAAGPPATLEDETPRLVWVGSLPWTARWQELKDHMGQAGTVEFAKVLTYDGSDFGRSRGSGYVRYATEAEAIVAKQTLSGTELNGRPIVVDAWTGGRVDRSSGKGFGFNFKGGFGYGKGAFKGGMPFAYGKGFGKSAASFGKVQGDPQQMVYIGNLPWSVRWQDLKDHMKVAGNVEFSRVLTDDGSDWGRSRGIGCIRYSTPEAAQIAITTLNGSDLQGRAIVVEAWKSLDKSEEELISVAP